MTTPTIPPTALNRPRTDLLATVALACSILWIAGLGSIIGIALGRFVNRRLADGGLGRSRTATAAIWLGVAGLCLCVFAAALVIGSSPAPGNG